MSDKKRKPSVFCADCDHAIYCGNGDFYCEVMESLVVEGWDPQHYPAECGGEFKWPDK